MKSRASREKVNEGKDQKLMWKTVKTGMKPLISKLLRDVPKLLQGGVCFYPILYEYRSFSEKKEFVGGAWQGKAGE